jgi:hypothetical protein
MGNTLDAVLHAIVSPFNPLYAAQHFQGGYEADPSYQRNFEQGSAAYQFGHQVGYAGAEIGFQAGMAFGLSAFGRMASVAAAGGEGAGMTAFGARSLAAMEWEAEAGASQASMRLAGPTMTGSSGAGQAVVLNINASSIGSRVTTAYQNFYNDGWRQTVQRFVAGDIKMSSGQDLMTVLGQRTDALARQNLRFWADQQGLSGDVLINKRLYDPSGSGLYRVPDVRIPRENLILDGTIGTKTPLTPQIRDFMNWSGGRVQVINPRITPMPGYYK